MFSSLRTQNTLWICRNLLGFLLFSCLAERVFCSSVLWPAGRYGLPMPKSHCPIANGFSWTPGHIHQDLEDGGNQTTISPNVHLQVTLIKNDVLRFFCMKTDGIDANRKTWPAGQYCIYQQGSNCPAGMLSGSVLWDDKNGANNNWNFGSLPKGVYKADTQIFFCCHTNGSFQKPIELPIDKPFYLIAFTPHCQEVLNTVHTMEYIVYDTEDDNNHDNQTYPYPYGADFKPPRIHYCYYQAGKPTATSIPTSNSNKTSTATTLPQTITNATTPKVPSNSKVTSEEPSLSTRRPSSTPHTEMVTKDSTESGTSTTATDRESEFKTGNESAASGNVTLLVLLAVLAFLIVISAAVAAAVFYFWRKSPTNGSHIDQERLAVGFSTMEKAATPDMKHRSGANNNKHYTEITILKSKDNILYENTKNRDGMNTYEEVKDRKNPLYDGSDDSTTSEATENPTYERDVANTYEEVRNNKNPLYNNSVENGNSRESNDPTYERISAVMKNSNEKRA